MALLIRNDDVSMASRIWELLDMYKIIKEKIPNAIIWSAVTVFSKGRAGPVNPKATHGESRNFADEFYYDVDDAWRYHKGFGDKIVSHGLFHIDHTHLDYKAVEMSILGSCKYLKTDVFVPPYGYINDNIIAICKKHSIKVEHPYPSSGWLSLELNKFNPKHEKWYFHSWRYSVKDFKEALEKGI